MLFRKKSGRDQDSVPGMEVSSASAANASDASAADATPAGLSGDIVAAITAVIAAASGMSPSSFRIASINPCGYDGGFNTPIWGRVERFTRK